MPRPALPLQALLDLLAPTTCAGCGAVRGSVPFAARGAAVPGLRPWDDVPLCRACLAACGPPCRARLDAGAGDPLAVWAACATGPLVADLVAGWKYRGRRGLAWPLAALLAAAWRRGGPPPDVALVPVPLHRGRRRRRGFNQAALLARLLAAADRRPLRPDLLRRVRATGQQARLADSAARRRNVAAAFRADPAARTPPLVLVDDVVTSGATVAAAARALAGAGHRVAGVLAVATSLPGRGPVDTPGPGF